MFTVYIVALQMCPGTGKFALSTKLLTIINQLNRTNSLPDYVLMNCIMFFLNSEPGNPPLNAVTV